MPTPRTPLVGRAEELARLVGLLDRPEVRLVTLTGVPGVGKTRLAVEAASAVEREFGVTTTFVPLAREDRAAQIPAALDAARRRRFDTEHTVPGRARSDQGADFSVAVLDNVEHLSDAADEIAALLTRSPHLTVLATSTGPLRVDGEQVFRLGPLAHRAAATADTTTLVEQPSVQLFTQCAMAADAGFALTEDAVRTVAELCHELGGLPLAIELAAARIPAFSPAALLAQLHDRHGLDLLRRGTGPHPARHTSMRQALNWTYDLLTVEDQRMVARLAMFEDSFSLAGVAAVGEAPERVRPDIDADLFDALGTLVDTRLVDPCPQAGALPRFHLPPLVRRFAREHLAHHGDLDATRERHGRFVQVLCDEADARFEDGDHSTAFAMLEPEWPEITAVLDRLVAAGRTDEGLRLAVACAPFLIAVGYDTHARGRLDHLIEAARRRQGIDAALLARALSWSAFLACQTPNPARHARWAAQRLAESTALARAGGDERALLLALELTTVSLPTTGDLPGAVAALEEGRRLAEQGGDEGRLARFEAVAAMLLHQRGEVAAALALGGRALDRAQRRDDRRSIILASLMLLGLGELPAGASLPPMPTVDELLALCRETRHHQARTYILSTSAFQRAIAGDFAGAVSHCIEHLTLVRELGGTDTVGPALSIMTLVIVAVQRGDREVAAGLHQGIGPLLSVLELSVTPRKFAAYRAAVAELPPAAPDPVERSGGSAHPAVVATEAPQSATLSQALAYARSLQRTLAPASPSAATLGAGPAHRARTILTPREWEVLQLLATGRANRGVGLALGLTPKTVTHHCSSIYRKLSVRGRTEAVVWAYRNGFVEPLGRARATPGH